MGNEKQKPKKGFEVVDHYKNHNIWMYTIKALHNKSKYKYCPKCISKLSSAYTFIPFAEYKYYKVPGYFCKNCDCIYVDRSEEVKELLKDNSYAKGFTFNGRPIWNYSERKRIKKEADERAEAKKAEMQKEFERLLHIPSSIMSIPVKFRTRENIRVTVVSNNKYASLKENIFHYSSQAGREFLSAALAPQREKCGKYNGEKFRVTSKPTYTYLCSSHPFSQDSANIISPKNLSIKTDGGYGSSVIDSKKFEIVDLLLYSPRTNRYEVMKATYDKEENYCFADIKRWRNYIKEYGNPEVSLAFPQSQIDGSSFSDLKAKSVLMAYGYNVNKNNGLSQAERQEILAEIIDLDILKATRIVGFLQFFIEMHSEYKYYNAREKWRTDKNFVENYKANPERFLLVKS